MDPKTLGSNLSYFREQKGDLLLNGSRVSVWENENILEMDG